MSVEFHPGVSSYPADHFIIHKPGYPVMDNYMSHPGGSRNTPSHFIVYKKPGHLVMDYQFLSPIQGE